ncbi:trypsin-3 isoform X2 [Brachyhypopomus gauderio]|uniref:trypsin-3 isoform X2 n=1 Tax=Brachyhypopomus gauderio TaxID=698409 RepID=UPI0040427A28
MATYILSWFLVVLTVFLANSGEDFIQSRIIGSYAATANSFKYTVSLQTSRAQHFCGGSLVHRSWVLTAARCNIGWTCLNLRVDHMMIVAGDHTLGVYEGTEQYSKPQSLIPHPHYDKSSSNADIMLIKLRAPIELSKYVSLAPLPKQNTGMLPGQVCWVSGWGSTSPGEGKMPLALHTINLPIISTAKCNGSKSFNGNITSNMICAGDSTGVKDTCQEDSGVPLECNGRVYGLVSWGNRCGDSMFPGVYTAVSRFRRWIDQTIYSSVRRCLKN